MGGVNTENTSGPVLIVVALPVEARPLVSTLNLKFHSHGEYRNDEFTLTVRSVEKMPGEKIQIKLRALGKLNGKAVETAKTLTVQLTDRG